MREVRKLLGYRYSYSDPHYCSISFLSKSMGRFDGSRNKRLKIKERNLDRRIKPFEDVSEKGIQSPK